MAAEERELNESQEDVSAAVEQVKTVAEKPVKRILADGTYATESALITSHNQSPSSVQLKASAGKRPPIKSKH